MANNSGHHTPSGADGGGIKTMLAVGGAIALLVVTLFALGGGDEGSAPVTDPTLAVPAPDAEPTPAPQPTPSDN
ncbi:hypothetical protein [Cognatishimia sp. F0-27]|uniref:hypothetical protein n=1 Tax=Cognatishimia sp. F0-27 TaxID=2816855 RepID=UPI001D0C2DB6|nr:hypothetical protein [Cognatishimia sp. F0-27]MCC1494918.1 hypothetical protein [Cognatishimia sp. F0-27]